MKISRTRIHPTACLNPFGKKKKKGEKETSPHKTPILCKDLLKESDFMWSNDCVLGEQQNENNQKTKLPLKLSSSPSAVQKKKGERILPTLYLDATIFVLSFKIIVFKIC